MRRSSVAMLVASVVATLVGAEPVLGQDVPGTVVAWGSNMYGQCNVPAPNVDFVAISTVYEHSLGLKADGSIVAWGANSEGECNVPVPNQDFVAVAAGQMFSFGLKSDGSILAWGWNYVGQCNVPAPNERFVAIAAYSSHGLGLKDDGSIVAWGYCDSGECNVPSPNTEFVAIAAGEYFSVGLRADRTVAAWGLNEQGQCDVPAAHQGHFVAIAAHQYHSVALLDDQRIVAWGRCWEGQCDVPPEHQGHFVGVGAGLWRSFGLKDDGSIVGWGHQLHGECTVPAPNSGFTAVAGGCSHTIGLRNRGWSTLVYLNGDNTLDPYSVLDFAEMEKAAWKHDILVCWDRRDPNIPSAYYKLRWVTDPNSFIGDPNSYILAYTRFPQGELDMGDPNTLTTFTDWAVNRYPAQHYALVIWNHGGGWGPRVGRGVSWDDTNGSSFLTTNQLRDAVSAIKGQMQQNVDVVGFDACLMQMIEVAYAVRADCTTVVGSEEKEPYDGWDYEASLSQVDPNSAPEHVCDAIVSAYGAQGFPTQSAFRTNGLTDLAQRVDDLAAVLIANLPAQRCNILRARHDPNTLTFDYNSDTFPAPPTNLDSYVDLGQLCGLLVADCNAPDVQSAANAVRSALAAARIANRTNAIYASAEGISMYFPHHLPDLVGAENYYRNYQNAAGTSPPDANLDFVADTRWDEFLRRLLETGDMNCNGVVNYADINAFSLALWNQAAYEAAYPNCRWLNGDCNADGLVNFADINPFMALLGGC